MNLGNVQFTCNLHSLGHSCINRAVQDRTRGKGIVVNSSLVPQQARKVMG